MAAAIVLALVAVGAFATGTWTTTVSVASSPNPTQPGQSVHLGAIVSESGYGTYETGSVTLSESFDGDAPDVDVCPNLPLSGSSGVKTASCDIAVQSPGVHLFIAKYSGDANYAAQNSSAISQIVEGIVQTINTPASEYSQRVSVAAVVTGNNPTGTVTFSVVGSSLALCSAALSTEAVSDSKEIQCDSATLTPGTYSVQAQYPGDGNNPASTSNQGTVTVSPAVSHTSLTAPVSGSVSVGAMIHFATRLTVDPNVTIAPTGMVRFIDGGADGSIANFLCIATTQPDPSSSLVKTAGCDAPISTPGNHVIGAEFYQPDSPYMTLSGSNESVTLTVLANPATAHVNLDQHGLTGSWGRSDAPGTRQGLLFNFYPDNVAAGHGTVFAGWYTYDVAGGTGGQRWYALQGDVYNTSTSASLGIYTAADGNLESGARPASAQVGTATLSFSDCSTGTLTYAFNDGRAGSIPLSRVTHSTVTCGVSGDTGAHAQNYLLSGAWIVTDTVGMGFVIDVSPADNTLLGSWYTYFPAGNPSPSPRQQWFVFQDSNFAPTQTSSSNIDLLQATGGTFDATVGVGVTTATVGSVSLAFTSCTTATFTYAISTELVSLNTVNLVRLGPAPAGCALP